MKIIFIFTFILMAQNTFAKSTALTYDISHGFYTLEHEVKPKRFLGIMYQNVDTSAESYTYEGQAFGISLSMKELKDGGSVNLFLSRFEIDRFQCQSCVQQEMISYLWGLSTQYNWVWDWGLYLYAGVGIHFQYKTYDYQSPSLKGPQFYFPIGLGFAF